MKVVKLAKAAREPYRFPVHKRYSLVEDSDDWTLLALEQGGRIKAWRWMGIGTGGTGTWRIAE